MSPQEGRLHRKGACVRRRRRWARWGGRAEPQAARKRGPPADHDRLLQLYAWLRRRRRMLAVAAAAKGEAGAAAAGGLPTRRDLIHEHTIMSFSTLSPWSPHTEHTTHALPLYGFRTCGCAEFCCTTSGLMMPLRPTRWRRT